MKKHTINGYRLVQSDDLRFDRYFRLTRHNQGIMKQIGKHDNKVFIFCILMIMLYTLNGCTAASESPQIIQPVAQPSTYQEPAPHYPSYGSIFNANDARYLYEDSRARRVGDIVTINVIESSSGSQSATTSTSGETTANLGVNSFLGMRNFLGIPIGATPALDISKKSEFEGDGSTSRNNSITTTLAARVINVMPNGNMQIEAVRETKINNETQFMLVTGLIRANDISANNTIASTRIANAKIEFYGQGILSAQQKPGWLMRFLDFISPF